MIVRFGVSAASAAPAAAQITLERIAGPPTTSTHLRGRGFGATETIDVTFDGSNLRHAVTGPDGTFLTRITIPASALPGPHRIRAAGESSGRSARTSFTVRTDWPRFHFDNDSTGHNPYENVLDTSNVTGLQALWNEPISGQVIDSSPAVANGTLYVGSYDLNGDLYALDASTGAVRWTFPTGPGNTFPSIHSSPAVSNGVVYVGAQDHNLYAIDAATGVERWHFTTGSAIYSSPVVANGVVYFGSFDHSIYAISAATGQKLWNHSLGSQVISNPAVANGVVYETSSSGDELYALDATTGTTKWTYIGVDESPTVVDGVVYVGNTFEFPNDLYAIDAATGTKLWGTTVGGTYGGVTTAPAVADGVVYVGTGGDDNSIHAVAASDGALLWTFATGGHVTSSPAVANGVVYAGSFDDNLYALDASTGALLRSFATRYSISSSPAVADGVVYLGSEDDSVYALGLTAASSPPARANASMAHDGATGSMVLWGGTSSTGGRLSDTWTWDGSTWTEQHPVVSPPPNFAAPMAYDQGSGEVVLLTIQGTWTWDGSNWTLRVPSQYGQPGGGYAEMAYDQAVGQIVLFDQTATTWTWNGSGWTQLFPPTSPSLRYFSSMAWSPAGGNLVLFGGYGDGDPNNPLDETWTWDGSNWTLQQPAHVPMSRHGAGAADDPIHGNIVLFGGVHICCGPPFLDDTWTWDGADWTQRSPATSPPSLDGSSMAFDDATGLVVLFGGRDNVTQLVTGQTWQWDGSNWTRVG